MLGIFDFIDTAKVVSDVVEGVGKGVKKVSDSSKSTPDNNNNTNIDNNVCFCTKCGAKLSKDMKFCSSCGSQLNGALPNNAPVAQTPPPVPASQGVDNSKRQNEYAGKIIKCPNCGEVIDQTKAVCPSCGINISGRSTLSSVQQFNQQLKEIQDAKNNQSVVNLFLNPLDETDAVVDLIKNFPVPNTIEDIVEFMILATSSIKVKVSKKRAFVSAASDEKKISDAWVDKMKQLYKKAEFSFSEHKAFKQVKNMYEEKMRELKLLD